MLTERRARILGYIVDEYVNSVQPVGSAAVASKYGLAISPATIRNEMMRLEEEGYIAQPHTSAGRVPSDKGYRYYVEALLPEEALSPPVREMIRHQFHQVAREVEEWARLAASVLARQVENAALVTAPHAQQARLRWLELVRVQELLALLIVVLQGARVCQQTLALQRPLDQGDLSVVARKLNQLLAGLTAREIRQRGLELTPFEMEVAAATAKMLEAEDETSLGPAVLEGLPNTLRQPEFAQGERVLDLLDILEERNRSRAIPIQNIAEEGVTVIIGHEHPEEALRQCSVVVTRYLGPGGVSGVIGVVGPTRMQYARTISMVRHVASLMEELLEVYFG